MLQIMTLVSLSTAGYDREFILRRRLSINIINKRGPRIDPWGIPCFNFPSFREKILFALGDFTSTLCLLLVK